MKAFKIVRKEYGKLLSYNHSLFREPLIYEINKLVKPKKDCGPLACFKDLKSALEFIRLDFGKSDYLSLDWNTYAIYECNIKQASENYLWFELNSIWPLDYIPGSVCGWSVTLTREITLSEIATLNAEREKKIIFMLPLGIQPNDLLITAVILLIGAVIMAIILIFVIAGKGKDQ